MTQIILFCLTRKPNIPATPARLYLCFRTKYEESKTNNRENTSVYIKKKKGKRIGKKQYCRVLITEEFL